MGLSQVRHQQGQRRQAARADRPDADAHRSSLQLLELFLLSRDVQAVRGSSWTYRGGAERAQLGGNVARLPRRLLEVRHLRESKHRAGIQSGSGPDQTANQVLGEGKKPAVAAAAPAGASRSAWRRLLGEAPIGYLFVAPFVIYLVGIYAYPFFYAIYMSFFDYF